MTTDTARGAAGALLRDWRLRRHRSQMDLALETGVSTRHLSFVETGARRPLASSDSRRNLRGHE
jgi:transcriptional regulator with XRE-family HTH domain